MPTVFSVLQTIILVTALSVDAFVASFAYGANKIKIPLSSVNVINLICTAFVILSTFIGSVIKPWLSDDVTTAIYFSILFLLGLFKLFDSSLKRWIGKTNKNHGELKFRLFDFKFILHVYADVTAADVDRSRTLSAPEAASLAVALSLDGIAVGFGAGFSQINYLELAAAAFFMNFLAIICGSHIGNKIAKKINTDLSWLGGVLLIALAFLKLK